VSPTAAGADRATIRAETDEEFAAYVQRASYFNASARTSKAYLGLMFRRPPFVKLPADGAGVGRAMAVFQNDADMLGTTLTTTWPASKPLKVATTWPGNTTTA